MENNNNNKKLVSLLLMTYNCSENLKTTLKSIEMQDYTEIEVVVSDGKSSDGTLEILKEFSEKSKYHYDIVSEKDNGLYNALNKDINRANGDYLMVMNDQLLYRDAISKLVESIEKENSDGAHADLIYATDEKVVRLWRMGNGSIYSGWMPGHPTLMVKKEVYQKYGLYSEEYSSAADYEFMVRFLKDKTIKLSYVPRVLVRMYYGGTSTVSFGSYIKSLKEGHEALVENNVKGALLIDFLRTFRVCLQFINVSSIDKKWKDKGRK